MLSTNKHLAYHSYLNHTSTLKTCVLVTTLQDTWRCKLKATGWPCVSILRLGDIGSLICISCPSGAGRKTVWADPVLKKTRLVFLGHQADNKHAAFPFSLSLFRFGFGFVLFLCCCRSGGGCLFLCFFFVVCFSACFICFALVLISSFFCCCCCISTLI